MKIFISEKS